MIQDHEGREIPEPHREAVVKVWEISPHRSNGYSHCLVMGWQGMHEELSSIAVERLENMTADEQAEGLTIKVRLIEMEYSELLDAMED